MQIRSQYLIQDNHDDYTSQSAFSRGTQERAHTRLVLLVSSFFLFLVSFSFARALILFHPLTVQRLVGNLEVARIALRRGLVAKMHRCLSYNMLAMHLERVRAPIPDCRQRTRRTFSKYPCRASTRRKISGSLKFPLRFYVKLWLVLTSMVC